MKITSVAIITFSLLVLSSTNAEVRLRSLTGKKNGDELSGPPSGSSMPSMTPSVIEVTEDHIASTSIPSTAPSLIEITETSTTERVGKKDASTDTAMPSGSSMPSGAPSLFTVDQTDVVETTTATSEKIGKKGMPTISSISAMPTVAPILVAAEDTDAIVAAAAKISTGGELPRNSPKGERDSRGYRNTGGLTVIGGYRMLANKNGDEPSMTPSGSSMPSGAPIELQETDDEPESDSTTETSEKTGKKGIDMPSTMPSGSSMPSLTPSLTTINDTDETDIEASTNDEASKHDAKSPKGSSKSEKNSRGYRNSGDSTGYRYR